MTMKLNDFDFLVTGHPRCSTAWLSDLFTWGKNICLNEPHEWPMWEDQSAKILEDLGSFDLRGIATVNAPVGTDDFDPEKPTVVVFDSEDRLRTFFRNSARDLTPEKVEATVLGYQGRLVEWSKGRNIMKIHRSELFRADTLTEVLKFVGCEVPTVRFYQMLNLNVQEQRKQKGKLKNV